MNTRQANEKDIPSIVEINKVLEIKGCEQSKFPQIKEWIGENLGDYFVYEENGKIKGAMLLNKYGRITQLAVEGDSQHQGIGRTLIDLAKQVAIKNGNIALKAESNKSYNVKGFYETCGFSIMKEEGANYIFRAIVREGFYFSPQHS